MKNGGMNMYDKNTERKLREIEENEKKRKEALLCNIPLPLSLWDDKDKVNEFPKFKELEPIIDKLKEAEDRKLILEALVDCFEVDSYCKAYKMILKVPKRWNKYLYND